MSLALTISIAAGASVILSCLFSPVIITSSDTMWTKRTTNVNLDAILRSPYTIEIQVHRTKIPFSV